MSNRRDHYRHPFRPDERPHAELRMLGDGAPALAGRCLNLGMGGAAVLLDRRIAPPMRERPLSLAIPVGPAGAAQTCAITHEEAVAEGHVYGLRFERSEGVVHAGRCIALCRFLARAQEEAEATAALR